jgi:hypothetical protein
MRSSRAAKSAVFAPGRREGCGGIFRQSSGDLHYSPLANDGAESLRPSGSAGLESTLVGPLPCPVGGIPTIGTIKPLDMPNGGERIVVAHGQRTIGGDPVQHGLARFDCLLTVVIKNS